MFIFPDFIQPFPCILALLSNRNKAAFDDIIHKLENKWNLQATVVWIDFERNLRSTVYDTYPGVTMKCFWYNYCIAVQQKAKTFHGLFERTYNDTDAETLFHQFMCMPFVPPDKAKQAFDYLKDKAHSFAVFRDFVLYFEKVWMGREGPSNFCIDWEEFPEPSSANFNLNLKKKFINPDSKCSFYNFIKLIHQECKSFTALYDDISEGPPVIHQSRRSQLIKKEHESLLNGSIDLQQFFKRLTFKDNTGCIDNLNNYDIGDEHEIPSDNDEFYDGRTVNVPILEVQPQESTETCSICLMSPKNTILHPCNHLKFCKECIDILLSPQVDEYGVDIIPKCPICRAIITGHTLAFLWYTVKCLVEIMNK